MRPPVFSEIVGTSIILPTLGILTVGLRLYSRRAKSRDLFLDDWLVVAALIVIVCHAIAYITAAFIGGVGFHMNQLDEKEITLFFKFVFALQFTYLLAVTTVKLSILLCYKRVFVTPKFGIAIKIMCVLVMMWFTAFFFATLLQTRPLSNNWQSNRSGRSPGTTINVYAMFTTSAVVEILLDVVTLILPLFVIWRLQMRLTQKWQVSGVFLLGSFVCLASIMRLHYLVLHLNPSAEEEEDLTYNLADIGLWSAIEPYVGVICACLPTIDPVFQHRALKSIIRRLKDSFFIRSGHWEDRDRSLPGITQNSVISRRPHGSNESRFYPMDDEQSLVTDVPPLPQGEQKTESFPLGSIMVNPSIQSKMEEGKQGRL